MVPNQMSIFHLHKDSPSDKDIVANVTKVRSHDLGLWMVSQQGGYKEISVWADQ